MLHCSFSVLDQTPHLWKIGLRYKFGPSHDLVLFWSKVWFQLLWFLGLQIIPFWNPYDQDSIIKSFSRRFITILKIFVTSVNIESLRRIDLHVTYSQYMKEPSISVTSVNIEILYRVILYVTYNQYMRRLSMTVTDVNIELLTKIILHVIYSQYMKDILYTTWTKYYFMCFNLYSIFCDKGYICKVFFIP